MNFSLLSLEEEKARNIVYGSLRYWYSLTSNHHFTWKYFSKNWWNVQINSKYWISLHRKWPFRWFPFVISSAHLTPVWISLTQKQDELLWSASISRDLFTSTLWRGCYLRQKRKIVGGTIPDLVLSVGEDVSRVRMCWRDAYISVLLHTIDRPSPNSFN